MAKKETRKQIRMDEDDERRLERLKKSKRYGSTDSEVLRRGLLCLEEQEKPKK